MNDAYTAILQKIEAAREKIPTEGLRKSEEDEAYAALDDAEAAVRAVCPLCPDPIPPEDD